MPTNLSVAWDKVAPATAGPPNSIEMQSTPPAAEPLSPLASYAAAEVVECAMSIASTGMPLPAGLRAAAQEADSWRVAAGLRRLAAELERGRSLDDCLTSARGLPPFVAGLIRAAQRTGDTSVTLAAWSTNRRGARQYWHATIAALIYPALSIGLALALFFMMGVFLIPLFRTMYGEFGLKLPVVTTYLFRAVDFGTWFFPFIAGLTLMIAVVTRVFGGRSAWSALVTNLPLIGCAWHWTGVAEMLRCLGLLVERRVPLPDALRLTADGISDEYVALQCRNLAGRVAEGRSLTMSLVALRTLPLSIVPLVRIGEQQDTLDASLRSAAQLLENRLKLRTHVLAQIVPPLVFAFVAVSLAWTVIALYLPMISLIQGLS